LRSRGSPGGSAGFCVPPDGSFLTGGLFAETLAIGLEAGVETSSSLPGAVESLDSLPSGVTVGGAVGVTERSDGMLDGSSGGSLAVTGVSTASTDRARRTDVAPMAIPRTAGIAAAARSHRLRDSKTVKRRATVLAVPLKSG
jgi:hypothetical protein